MKKIISMFLFVMVFVASSLIAYGSDSPGKTPGAIKINGCLTDSKAIIEDGLLYLPIRVVGESLGYQVGWIQESRTVTLRSTDDAISLSLADLTLEKNGHTSYLTDRCMIIDGTAYLYANFFSENLALAVRQNKTDGAIELSSIKENPITIKNVKEISENETLKTTLQYPIIEGLTNRPIQDEINKVFKGLAENAAAEGKTNADQLSQDISQLGGDMRQCETYFNYLVKYNQNNIISVVLQNYQYSGGAHGSTVQSAYTFNLETGQQYKLKDLFQDNTNYIDMMNKEVIKQLKERELFDALLVPYERFKENQYYLSNNGVVVFFQQYEILPYAAGIQEFLVTDDLENLYQNPGLFD